MCVVLLCFTLLQSKLHYTQIPKAERATQKKQIKYMEAIKHVIRKITIILRNINNVTVLNTTIFTITNIYECPVKPCKLTENAKRTFITLLSILISIQ